MRDARRLSAAHAGSKRPARSSISALWVVLAQQPSERQNCVHNRRPLGDVRSHFSDVIDRLEHEHERVTVTRNGRPVAVVLSLEDLAELEETLRSAATHRPWPTSAKPMRRMPQVKSFAESMTFAPCARERRARRTDPPPAIRAVGSGLPEGVAAAVIEFLTSVLVENPHRVGKQLRVDLAGIHSARPGTYGVLYRLNEV
jgi:prevent-host-death family protein